MDKGLDHCTIFTALMVMGETADFFVRVIGLTAGPQPEFHLPGKWMYAARRPAGRPILHIVARTADDIQAEAYSDGATGSRAPAA